MKTDGRQLVNVYGPFNEGQLSDVKDFSQSVAHHLVNLLTIWEGSGIDGGRGKDKCVANVVHRRRI